MKYLLRLLFFVFVAIQLQSTLAQVHPGIARDVYTDNDYSSIVIRGDVNGDAEVTIADVNVIIDIILGGTSNEDVRKRADVNNDGEVTIADINAVIDIILSGGIAPNPDTKSFTINGVSFKMVAVKGGTFTMGATSEQVEVASSNEYPPHQVTLSDYFIGQTEVTQELWIAVMDSNPSYYANDLQQPVEYVSWDDCQAFITKLNSLTGQVFRLPTEAEWEFAARGGNMTKGFMYAGSNSIGHIAWYADNGDSITHAVAKKSPNELGLYDMSGNVFEWCEDWYDSYLNGPQNDPTGPESGRFRVLRGGCYDSSTENCRVSCRNYSSSTYHGDILGLRLALSPGYTSIPEISTRTGDSTVTITATGDGIVTLYVNNQVVPNPYIANRTETDYTISVYATAQEDGMNMSQSETMDINIPALEYSAVPVVTTQMNEYAVTVTATGKGTVALYVNGQVVSNPYIASRSNSAYTITVYATAKEDGKIMNQSETKNILIPALEYTSVPIITTQTDDSTVLVTATGNGTVTLYVNNQAVSNPYMAFRSNTDYTISAYATAKEEGKVMGQSEMKDITVPALEYSAVPTITSEINESTVTVMAIGNGVLTLYVNDQIVPNPHVVPRNHTDYTITAYATAKEVGKIISQCNPQVITIPALTTEADVETITINGVTFRMISIEGGTFMMGATPEQGDEVLDKEKPVHQVTVSPFAMGQTEVTQELWQAVMGSNPSHFTGDLKRPVESISWNDCQTFIARLNQLTGRLFRLPTEAEWEYAARGGNKDQVTRYAGSDNIGDVAWYNANSNNSTHPVATKAPNELGLYDMTGNVWEWCQDWYALYDTDAQINPTGPATGTNRVLRGGCWNGNANYDRISFRDNFTPTGSNSSGGLRLVLGQEVIYTVNGVSFKMIPVKGGSFMMGATEEEDADYTVFKGSPKHQVTLSSYSIGQTEVTQELWNAVMGSNPSSDSSNLQYPVHNINWLECDAFITKLNELTGMQFRLPTEAEWEYAAKGGALSQGFVYSGSDNLDEVAWIDMNSDNHVHLVATKKANELGLYDMNGNIEEWINDWYSLYTEDAVVNPMGPDTGISRIHRGGRWNAGAKYCRLTRRDGFVPTVTRTYMGLRLAL